MKAARRWMAIGVLAAAFAGGAVAQWALTGCASVRAAQTQADDTLRARAVIIVDDEGRERIFLGMDGEKVTLALRDPEGRDRIEMGYTGTEVDYWALGFMDANGQARFGCGARGDGVESGGHVSDANGVLRISFGEGPSGTGIDLRNEAGQARLGIGIAPGAGGGDFVMKGAEGSDLWRASQTVAPD